MTGMVTSLTVGVMGYADTSLGADFLLMPQSVAAGGGNVGAGPQLAQAMRETPGVAGVTTLRASTTRIGEADLQLVGIDPRTYPAVSGLVFSAGDPEQVYAELRSGRTLVANEMYAAMNGIEVGQELTLQTAEGAQVYRVVGIGVDYLNMKVPTCYISQANLAQDFHKSDDLVIMINQSEDADAAVTRAAVEELARDYPAFSLYTYEEWRQVRRMILGESLLLSATGTAFGILAGLWLGYIFVAGMNAFGMVMEYFFPYGGILLTVAVGLLFGVLAALIPTRQATRMDVVAALQYE